MTKPHFEYFDIPLKSTIQEYIDDHLKNKDWEIVAIDTHKDIIILRRFVTEKTKEATK